MRCQHLATVLHSNLGRIQRFIFKNRYLIIDRQLFENFHNTYIKSYGLDPAHYYTLPFCFNAMMTRVNFKLLTDIDMMFIECIRGGLSQCSNRYARTNNK